MFIEILCCLTDYKVTGMLLFSLVIALILHIVVFKAIIILLLTENS